jgi:hypothetical protein
MDKTFLQYKKELLIRKNRGEQIYDKYLNKITNLFSIDKKNIIFIPLEESDLIRKKNITNKLSVVSYAVSNPDIYHKIIQEIKKTGGSYYVFIDHDWEFCGCFQISSLNSLKDSFRFGKLITDDIVLIESSFLSKIAIDYYEMNSLFFIDVTFYDNCTE